MLIHKFSLRLLPFHFARDIRRKKIMLTEITASFKNTGENSHRTK